MINFVGFIGIEEDKNIIFDLQKDIIKELDEFFNCCKKRCLRYFEISQDLKHLKLSSNKLDFNIEEDLENVLEIVFHCRRGYGYSDFDPNIYFDIINSLESEYKARIIGLFILNNENLKILSKDEDENVRASVVKVCKDENIYMKLAKDKKFVVREAVADYCNNNEILESLVNDRSWKVRRIVAECCTNKTIIKELTNDTNDCVREVAIATLNEICN